MMRRSPSIACFRWPVLLSRSSVAYIHSTSDKQNLSLIKFIIFIFHKNWSLITYLLYMWMCGRERAGFILLAVRRRRLSSFGTTFDMCQCAIRIERNLNVQISNYQFSQAFLYLFSVFRRIIGIFLISLVNCDQKITNTISVETLWLYMYKMPKKLIVSVLYYFF